MTLQATFEIKEFNSAALAGWYQVFGIPLSNPCFAAVIMNESDTPVYISVDGSADNFRVGAHQTLPMSSIPRHSTTNKGEYLLNKGTQLYIRYNIGPGSGYIVFHALMTT